MSEQDAMASAVGWDGMRWNRMAWHGRSEALPTRMAIVLPDPRLELEPYEGLCSSESYPQSDSKR